MTKFAATLLPELKAVLEHNGIDWKRCSVVKISHDANDAVTEISVTMLALHPKTDES
jgi:hypothetical protein